MPFFRTGHNTACVWNTFQNDRRADACPVFRPSRGPVPSSKEAPRVVVTNGMVIPNYSSRDHWERFNALGVSQYGQMTAGSFMYIGPQGIVHGTTITIMNAARRQKHVGRGSLLLFPADWEVCQVPSRKRPALPESWELWPRSIHGQPLKDMNRDGWMKCTTTWKRWPAA